LPQKAPVIEAETRRLLGEVDEKRGAGECRSDNRRKLSCKHNSLLD
jgi:hypothetical protein